MNIIRWQPFSDPITLRQVMDRFFDDRVVSPSLLTSPFSEMTSVPIDMYQTDKAVVVKASLPGIEPEEVDISITGDVLTIKGEHKEEHGGKEENYFRREHRYGTFCRTLPLPVPIETEKAEAVFENGVLALTLPKVEEAKPKQIKVKPKGAIEGENA